MSNERAETYLRRLAEAELRRASGQLRDIDARAAASLGFEPGMDPFVTQSTAQWKALRTGRILAAAGALNREFVDRVSADLHVAIRIRSRVMLDWDCKRGMLQPTLLAAPSRPPLAPGRADRALSVTPIGQTLRVASGRAPSALHFLSLVRTETEAVLAVALRMQWPPDGSSADLETSRAGPHHLPYGQLLAMDDQETRYSLRFEGDARQMGTWQGIARLSPAPRPAPGDSP